MSDGTQVSDHWVIEREASFSYQDKFAVRDTSELDGVGLHPVVARFASEEHAKLFCAAPKLLFGCDKLLASIRGCDDNDFDLPPSAVIALAVIDDALDLARQPQPAADDDEDAHINEATAYVRNGGAA